MTGSAAAERDRALRTAGGVEAWPIPALRAGLGYEEEPVSPPLVGRLPVQGTVERDGRTGRFDDVVGRGFALIVDGDAGSLAPGLRAAFEAIGGRVATLGRGIEMRMAVSPGGCVRTARRPRSSARTSRCSGR